MGLLEAHAGLAGKYAAVIGGAGGYQGRAVSLALAEAGVSVASLDNDQEAVRTIVPEVEAHGVRMVSVHGDAVDVAALDAFYDRVGAEFGQLDIVINLVGGVKRSKFMDTTRDDNADDVRRNYGYVVDSIKRAVPLIRKGGRGGSIVNFTTIEAHRGAATFAVYAGAKAATTNFSRAVAVELAAEGIRVNLLAPDTSPAKNTNAALYPEDLRRLAELGPDSLEKSIEAYVPQKRAPSVDDLVNGVLFLVSDLSRSITGTVLHIDGGCSASWGFIDWPQGDGFMPAPLAGSIAKLFSD